MHTRTHVSLFAGIDAIGIAAHESGYATTAGVEQDPFCQGILRLRHPDAAIFDDVRSVGAAELGTGMDLLSGGFPCQDLSSAGKNAGLEGARSGLWFEFLRVIGECRPKAVLIENVAVLKSRGLDVVVQGLADAGYGCWWDCAPALAVGAPHLRDRIWITAVPRESMTGWNRRAARDARYVSDGGHLPADGRMPRAGFASPVEQRDGSGCRLYVWRDEPQATIKMAKVAAGAVKQPDGTTWLTALGSPLLPTPIVGDSRNSRNATAGRKPGGNHHSGTTLSAYALLFPTPTRRDWKSGAASPATHARNARPLNEYVRLWPTATARPRTHTPRPVHHGMQLANEVEREALRLWPAPSRAVGTGGPGRSPSRTGGDNLRTAAASSAGPLNPDWVEWLMGLPIGWTDPDCAAPVHRDWLSEHGIARTARNVPHRKQRLMACGNALVWRVAYTRLAELERLCSR